MPSTQSSKLKEIARRLRVYELTAGAAGTAAAAPAFRVCQRLRLPLGKLLGTDGFRALLSRALTLAAAQVPWLRGLHINAEGNVEGVEGEDLEHKWGEAALTLAEIALVAELLGLLVTFIG